MANSQLTAYVTAQLDKGVASDAIAQALIGAGWMQADVDAAIAEVVQQRGGAQPAVAAADAAAPATQDVAQPTSVTPASFFSTANSTPVDSSIVMAPKRSMSWLFVIVGVVLAIGIVGGLVYAFFMGGSDLPTVVDQDAASQQVSNLQQERDQLQGQVGTLTETVKNLENQLGIFSESDETSKSLTIRGTLATSSATVFTLRTSHDIILTVANASAAGVSSTLTPLVGAEVELTGTHAPGSRLLTVTAINGNAVSQPAAAAPATP